MDGYVPARLDKYRKVSFISGSFVRLPTLLMATPRRRINIDMLLGISATLLSLAALVVSIFQTRIDRQQQKASVWPYLKTSSDHIEDDFTFGIGPALI